ncbi:NAD-P-binding protein [Artomyces pyxidatus]|uniref:NAD-P-binding protein n=1 Tax=Artomyces pyxidatus TaxID=48021 RepID=A0ACB8TDP6_9AGAM|nr:NAD-P-binding protein [Artomyces pyxidatus]
MTTPTKTSEYRNSPSGSLSVMDYLAKVVGLDVDLQEVTTHNDIYPFIDPAPHFSARTFAKKVVLITGGSRGIGLSIAQHFARAGASLALVARDESVLETTKADIERDVTGARVLALPCDVRDSAQVSKAVASTFEHFGRLDVLVANAAVILPFGTLLGGVDPDAWWKTCEVGLRGAWNFIHFAVPHLQKSQGYVIAMTSVSGHLRLPTGSDSCIMKLALDRLIEFVPIEYPEIKTFAVHPGSVLTDIALRSNAPIPFDTKPELPASTVLHLAAGKADWLNGRYVSAQWDLGVVEQKYKTAIVEKNALVQKLALP